MPRPEDSQWAVSVAQIASRAGQSKQIDAVFPAPEGIGDDIVGVKPGADVHVNGSFDSIVDGLILTARISTHISTECTRCLKPIEKDWNCDVTLFFPYESERGDGHGSGYGNGYDERGRHGGKGGSRGGSRGGSKGGSKDEVEIIAGEEESEDTYPLLSGGAFADLEAPIRDTLAESLPLQPLCRPDCRGLCSQCGADLNEDPDHHHDAIDNRFAALAALREQLEAGGSEG